MDKRNCLKAMVGLPAAIAAPAAMAIPAMREERVTTKIPVKVDYAAEWRKEQTIPGYVQKKMAWADLDSETGEWTLCSDDDPIYQHPLAQEWHRY